MLVRTICAEKRTCAHTRTRARTHAREKFGKNGRFLLFLVRPTTKGFREISGMMRPPQYRCMNHLQFFCVL